MNTASNSNLTLQTDLQLLNESEYLTGTRKDQLENILAGADVIDQAAPSPTVCARRSELASWSVLHNTISYKEQQTNADDIPVP